MTRWLLGMRTTTLATATTLGATTIWTTAGTTVKTPPASGRFSLAGGGRVLIRIAGHLSGSAAVDLDGYRIGVQIDAVAFSDTDKSVTLANTGNNWHFEFWHDVTSYFIANDPGTETFTVAARLGFATGSASSVINVSAELYMVSGGDSTDTVSLRTQTAVMCVQSHHTTVVGDGVSYTEIGTTGGTANAPSNQIQRLDGGVFNGVVGFAVRQRYLVINAMINKSATTTLNIRVRHDGGGTVTTYTAPTQPAATNHKIIIMHDITGLDPAVAHSLEIGTDIASSMEHVGALDVITYEQEYDSAVNVVSVLLPLGNENSTSASFAQRQSVTAQADRYTAKLYIGEPDALALDCGVVLIDGLFSSGADTIVAALNQTERTYDRGTVSARDSSGQIVHRCSHSGGTWSVPFIGGVASFHLNVYVSASLATVTPVSGYVVVNYRCGLHPGGLHLHNRTILASLLIPYSETISAVNIPDEPVIPPTSYLISGALVETVNLAPVSGQNHAIRAQRQSDEDSGAGWYANTLQQGNNIAEIGSSVGYHDCTGWWRKRPESLVGANIEAERRWHAHCNSALVGQMAVLFVTYHAMSFAVSGTVTIDGDPAPGGLVRLMSIDDNGGGTEMVSATNTSDENVALTTPYKHLEHVVVYDDGAHRGSSVQQLPGGSDFDIDINSPAVDASLTSCSRVSDRWTPVVIRLVVAATVDMFLLYKIGRLEYVVYHPDTGFSAMFAGTSTIQRVGDDVTLTVLPTGGWSSREFSLTPVGGKEIT